MRNRRFAAIATATCAILIFSESSMAFVMKGAFGCGQWTKDRQDKTSPTYSQPWLLGYLSGLAQGRGQEFWGGMDTGINMLDNDSVYFWIDKYCMENPLKNIAVAGEALFAERRKMLGK